MSDRAFKLTAPEGYIRHVINAKGEHVGTWKHRSWGWTLHFPDGTQVRDREGHPVQCYTLGSMLARTVPWVGKLTPANQARMKEAEVKREAARQLRSKCFAHAEEIRTTLRAVSDALQGPHGGRVRALLKKLEKVS